MESLQKGGWPYLDPKLLDLRSGEGKLDFVFWPRTDDKRPILMHIKSLKFHYGAETATNRHNLVWFRDFGGKSTSGPSRAARFLNELFCEVWIPQMVAFVCHQLRQQFKLYVDYEDDCSGTELTVKHRRQAVVDTWEKSAQ
ncbi:hypothetical protein F5884DRAFT_861913 [Xylogone sp. PMI_703]|nr:hypothetical protein F5884DRAFT_861913 [Xylogone sp. PMI_703]